MNVFNGQLITTTATQVDIVPVELNEQGEQFVSGRNTFFFELKSGSVQTCVGVEIPAATATKSTAGDKWFHTATPASTNNYDNIKAKGVATFWIHW